MNNDVVLIVITREEVSRRAEAQKRLEIGLSQRLVSVVGSHSMRNGSWRGRRRLGLA
jgi:hypothetical protein